MQNSQRTFGKRKYQQELPTSGPSLKTGILIVAAVAAVTASVVIFSSSNQTVQTSLPVPTTTRYLVDGIGKAWVFDRRLARHSCPSETCGIVGELYFREAANVSEVVDGWGRVTKYYDASCVGQKSEFVESGNSACSTDNGIIDGQFAEWVSLAGLTSVRPDDPAESATGLSALIGSSDDFDIYETQFVTATQKLLDQGICSDTDLEDIGGWVQSQNFKPQPVYFTYCGDRRLYLDVSTGRVFE